MCDTHQTIVEAGPVTLENIKNIYVSLFSELIYIYKLI